MNDYFNIEELASNTGENARKLRYWMQVCELTDKRVPGQTAYYSQETLDRLRFIKKILDMQYEPSRGMFKPTLSQIKNFLEIISIEQIRDVLSGKEPLEVGYIQQAKEDAEPTINILSDKQLTMIAVDPAYYEASELTAMASLDQPDSALTYISQVMSKPPSLERKQDWQTLKLGTDLELRHRATLTSHQEQQLKLAGKLIQSILSKEK
jgi:DNA-binding transcriptional MerR regulator